MTDTPLPEALSSAAREPLVVACLCAQWCGTCRDYRAVLAQAGARFGADVRFVSIDIEDDEAWLDGIEVENFPTLLMANRDRVLFYGTVTPHSQTLQRLVSGALAGELPAVPDDPAVQALAQRLRRFPDA